jgi:hypothetical protein
VSLDIFAEHFVQPKIGLLAGDGAVLDDLTSGTGLHFPDLAYAFTFFSQTPLALILLFQVAHVLAGVFKCFRFVNSTLSFSDTQKTSLHL